MTDLVGEWLARAEEDFPVAASLLRRKKPPVVTICFHCQQAVEKYMQALLQAHNEHFGKTHKLLELLPAAQKFAPTLPLFADDLKNLTNYAVELRYPGYPVKLSQARSAVEAAKRLRLTLLAALGRRE